MEIQGAGNVQGPEPIRPHRIQPPKAAPAADALRSADSAEISEIGRLKALLKTVPDMRLETIQRLRAEIEAGTYESDDKLATVIDRLLEEI